MDKILEIARQPILQKPSDKNEFDKVFEIFNDANRQNYGLALMYIFSTMMKNKYIPLHLSYDNEERLSKSLAHLAEGLKTTAPLGLSIMMMYRRIIFGDTLSRLLAANVLAEILLVNQVLVKQLLKSFVAEAKVDNFIGRVLDPYDFNIDAMEADDWYASAANRKESAEEVHHSLYYSIVCATMEYQKRMRRVSDEFEKFVYTPLWIEQRLLDAMPKDSKPANAKLQALYQYLNQEFHSDSPVFSIESTNN